MRITLRSPAGLVVSTAVLSAGLLVAPAVGAEPPAHTPHHQGGPVSQPRPLTYHLHISAIHYNSGVAITASTKNGGQLFLAEVSIRVK